MDNVAQHLQRLQLGSARRAPHPRLRPSTATSDVYARVRRLLVRDFRSHDTSTFARLHAATGSPTPVFQVAFARSSGATRQQQLLAAVDEDGVVSLVDTSRIDQKCDAGRRGIYQDVHCKWQAHDNAIFDLVWSTDNASLFTAAGDVRVRCWDVETQASLATLEGGHSMSVKCVRQSSKDPNTIATGARDGNVLLWDLRTPSTSVAQLTGVHSVSLPSPAKASINTKSTMFVSPVGTNKRRRTAAGTTSSPRSVTSIEFLTSTHELITAGAVDSVVKFWDLRRLTAPQKTPSAPVRTLTCSSRAGAQRGITSLTLDHTRSKLLVSVLNDDLGIFDVGSSHSDPLLRLDGHTPSSFYVRAVFSPDGDFVTSGSSDGVVYVWDTTSRSCCPNVALKGHAGEVNGVAWHGSDFTRMASCSDDGTIRVWSAKRASTDASVADHSTETTFQLKRKQQRWLNWPEFEAQESGRAYTVDTGVDEEITSPSTIHRRSRAVATDTQDTPPASTPAARRRYVTPTLLDFWSNTAS